MDADRPPIRPALPDQVRPAGAPAAAGTTDGPMPGGPAPREAGTTRAPSEAQPNDGRPASWRRPRLVVDAVALLAAVFAVLGLIGVACGGWMAVDAWNSPEGMAGLAAYVMLMLSGMVAVGATTVAAVALYARGSNRVAAALCALVIAGVVGLFLLRLTA